ncbi:MAG: PAS domain S-box protein [Spirochaetes bacterium]|nr:PAS domain S-box protein [Spirochaetota bacterium]
MVFTSYRFTSYTWVHVAAAIAGIAVVAILRRRRFLPSARLLSFMQILVVEWTVASVFEVAATTVPLKLFWSQAAYIGTVGTPLFYFLFSMVYAQHAEVKKLRWIAGLAVIPVLTFIFAATNGLHHWVWTDIAINPENNIAVYRHGFWFWINIGYAYVIVLAGSISLIVAIFRFPAYYKSQIVLLLLGTVAPVVANVLYVFRLFPTPGFELTPVSFMFSGVFITVALCRFKMFDLVPFARKKLVDIMGDGVLLVYVDGRIADLNPAMEAIIGISAGELIGSPASRVFSDWKDVIDILSANKDERFETEIGEGKMRRFFDLYVSIVRSPRKAVAGRIIVFRDITIRKTIEDEREGLISELQNSLKEVKRLSGLLPICANCKKIRDDKGYWKDVEAYLNEHSDATLTHGICPDCMKKLYPEYRVNEQQ